MRYHTSLFCQVLGLLPPAQFQRLVRRTKAEAQTKGFRSWEQLVGMLFCHLAGAVSLREIAAGMKSACGKLQHLGVKTAPARSTLSYANAHRPAGLYEQLFYALLGHFASLGWRENRRRKFRFKAKLLSLDATVIELCLSLFPWAKFRQTKGAVKLHLLLDHDGYFPVFARITEGKVHEVNVARTLALAPGSIVVMDRGYNDYKLFRDWTLV